MNNTDLIDYSIIIPVYYNEGALRKTLTDIKELVINKNPDKKGEIIFVDDGSGDNSLQELLELRAENPLLIKVIKLTRNFGQACARMSGYEIAKGKCLVHISADSQDPPELINDMLNYHFNENYNVVVCTRDARDESSYRQITSKIFYYLIKKLSFPNMPQGGFDYLLISREVKDIIMKNKELNPFFQGQVLWTGYDIKFIPYKRRKRLVGKSMWTFSKKLKFLIDGVLSYSFFPLRFMSVTGFVVSLIGFLYAIVILYGRLMGNTPVKGWAPMMIVILILSGIQMLMLGVIGEYLWRILDQVRGRSQYIIENIYK